MVLRFYSLMLLYRDPFIEFGVKSLGFLEDELTGTPAYSYHCEDLEVEAHLLFRSRVLAFAPATWRNMREPLRSFQSFCRKRGLNPLNCTSSSLNIYLLWLGHSGKTFGTVTHSLDSVNFIYKFFLVRDNVVDTTVRQVLKYLEKLCPTIVRPRLPFGAAEVRKLWDAIDAKYGGLHNMPPLELRTFVMVVSMHASFCRFSDIAPVKISDIFFELDYFKIHLRYSKTDPTGKGQWAFIPRDCSAVRDPHMLMCLYLSSVHADQDESIFLFPPFE